MAQDLWNHGHKDVLPVKVHVICMFPPDGVVFPGNTIDNCEVHWAGKIVKPLDVIFHVSEALLETGGLLGRKCSFPAPEPTRVYMHACIHNKHVSSYNNLAAITT